MIVVLRGQKRCTIGESIIVTQLRTFFINNHVSSPRKFAEFLQNCKMIDSDCNNVRRAKSFCVSLFDIYGRNFHILAEREISIYKMCINSEFRLQIHWYYMERISFVFPSLKLTTINSTYIKFAC